MVTVHEEPSAVAMSMLSQCRTASERAERTLELLVRSSGAAAGFLYVMVRGRLELATSSHGEEPAAAYRADLQRLAATLPEGSLLATGPLDEGPDGSWQAHMLFAREFERSVPVVGAVLLSGQSGLRTPDSLLCEAVARSMRDEGDAVRQSTVTIGVPRP